MGVKIVVQPNSGSNLRHENHLRYHDNQIDHKENIELIGEATYLEFVFSLV